jgi:hypothetical protein
MSQPVPEFDVGNLTTGHDEREHSASQHSRRPFSLNLRCSLQPHSTTPSAEETVRNHARLTPARRTHTRSLRNVVTGMDFNRGIPNAIVALRTCRRAIQHCVYWRHAHKCLTPFECIVQLAHYLRFHFNCTHTGKHVAQSQDRGDKHPNSLLA